MALFLESFLMLLISPECKYSTPLFNTWRYASSQNLAYIKTVLEVSDVESVSETTDELESVLIDN